ncbi:MAG: sigma-54-dependent Fis family transcriptional regulator [Myxococcota bacterium]
MSKTLQESVLEAVVTHSRSLVGAERATLFLWDHSRDELFSRVADLPELTEIRVSSSSGLVGAAARSARALRICDAYEDSRFDRTIDDKTGYRTRSVLAMPIAAPRGNVLGVLQLIHGEPGRFGDSAETRLQRMQGEVAELLGCCGFDARRREPAGTADPVVGSSPAMRSVLEWVERVAPREIPVLLQGETGTGKGVIARRVHHSSARASGPFVVLDCTTLCPHVAESELFGHARGAFTGAVASHVGAFERARGGTLFIDEIGDLPLPLQGKLLRAVQDGEFLPVGGRETRYTDARIVAATHRDLREEVRQGRFRQDLFYRLAVLVLSLPPLRERGNVDVDLLLEHALGDIAKRDGGPRKQIDQSARMLLYAHDWPGNVRELRNVVERAAVYCEGETIRAEHIVLDSPETGSALEAGPDRLEDVQRQHVLRILARCDGNQSEAARLLGVARNTLRAQLARYRRDALPLEMC